MRPGANIVRILQSNDSPEAMRQRDLSRLREAPGAVVGAHRLVEQVGRGGFGTVWKAVRIRPFERQIAVKLNQPGH